jgi:triosephosphate isomerase
LFDSITIHFGNTVMRTMIIAGNWKMYKDLQETRDLLTHLTTAVPQLPANVVAIVCPPYVSLQVACELLKGSPIKLGAQNMSQHDEGAYTGEISGKMLLSAGCQYVILGHSERRQYFAESNDMINQKAKKALALGLLPIICVGETLQEREQGITTQVVTTQIKGVLSGIPARDMEKVIVAYEPVWAIGTGRVATPQQAQEVHQMIRKQIAQQYDWALAERIVIQYGGSVKPDNAADILAQNDVDGALVGGACLKSDSFAAIIKASRS